MPPSDCMVLDADGHKMTDGGALDVIRSTRPVGVGFTVTSKTCGMVEDWGSRVKELAAGGGVAAPVVVVGGPHAGFSPKEVFAKCPSVDVVVRGEGEPVFPKMVSLMKDAPARDTLLQNLSLLPGVLVRGKPQQNDSEILRVDADEFIQLPFPRLDSSAPVSNYWAPDARRGPMVTFMTQRGCPFKCGFCSSPNLHGRKVRGFSVDRIIAELQRLSGELGVREVSFVDDVFTVHPSRLLSLCNAMIERELDISWYCNARADQVSSRLAQAMAAAGCHQVFLGFESGCDAMLKRINKGATVAQLEHGAQVLKEAGIQRSVGFVVGLPGETDESVDKTIALCQRVQPERRQFTRWTPLAGSPLVLAGHGVPGSDEQGGFHDRTDDKVGKWLRKCYEQCPGNASV